MTTLERPVRPRRVHYPESDGKPMGETDLHRDLMTDLIFALKWFLRSTRAYVAGNLFIYYEEGNPRAAVAPDVFVVLGVEQRRRRIFQTWREGGRAPDVVIEITSKKTRKDDRERKPTIYAALGVREYFIFDPHGEYLEPPLQGYRLVQGAYEPIATYPLRSEVLNLELRQEDGMLRLYHPQTGERLPTSDEEAQARRAAEAARLAAEAARLAAEAARLAAERQLVIEAQARLAVEAARLAAEERAAQLEAEVARLRTELAKRASAQAASELSSSEEA
jgi:Uma2 family endonuclease